MQLRVTRAEPVAVDIIGRSTVVTIAPEELSEAEGVRSIREKLVELVDASSSDEIALNVENVPFVCSEALGVFALLSRRIQKRGGRLIACNATPVVEAVLRSVALDSIIEIREPTSSAATEDPASHSSCDDDQLRDRFREFGLIGVSDASLDVFRWARQFAQADPASVLISGIVSGMLQADPLCGRLFLFINRRRDRLKILYWDGDGLAIWYRRLEQGTFQLPHVADDQTSVELTGAELTMLLRGLDYHNVQRRKRFQVPA